MSIPGPNPHLLMNGGDGHQNPRRATPTQTNPDWWRERAEIVSTELSDLDRQVDEINQRRKVLQFARRQALRRVRYLETEKGGSAAGHDEFWISTTDLWPYLDRYYAEVGPEGGGWKSLARRADVNLKTIRNIRKGNTERTTFQVADRILTAMGITDVLDELIVVYTYHEEVDGNGNDTSTSRSDLRAYDVDRPEVAYHD